MKKLITILLALVCVPAFAEVNILPRLSSLTVAHTSTNSAMVQPIGWTIDQQACVQVVCTATNAAAASEMIVNWDTSNDGNSWKTSVYTTRVLQGGVTIARLTNSVGGQYLRVGSVVNTNTTTQGTVVFTQFNYVPKDQ